MIPYMENFGAHLTAVLEQFNVELEDLATSTELSEARLRDITENNKPIFAYEVFKIAQALGVLVSDLLGDPTFLDMADDMEVSTDTCVFRVQGWLPHNVAITSLQDLTMLKSKPPRKSVLYSVEVSYHGTDKDVEKWYQTQTGTSAIVTVESLLGEET